VTIGAGCWPYIDVGVHCRQSGGQG